jgi:hypothetical protein
MRVEYGPPGHRGVTQIMGLGETSIAQKASPGRLVAGGAALTYIAGMALGSNMAKNMGLGAGLALFALHALKQKQPTQGTPQSIQGW